MNAMVWNVMWLHVCLWCVFRQNAKLHDCIWSQWKDGIRCEKLKMFVTRGFMNLLHKRAEMRGNKSVWTQSFRWVLGSVCGWTVHKHAGTLGKGEHGERQTCWTSACYLCSAWVQPKRVSRAIDSLFNSILLFWMQSCYKISSGSWNGLHK